jgi:hypothetical protein
VGDGRRQIDLLEGMSGRRLLGGERQRSVFWFWTGLFARLVGRYPV